MKKPIYLTTEELSVIQHILYHFSDYMNGDDRPDHGLGILKDYRESSSERKSQINVLAGRLRRLHRKWSTK